MTVAVRYNGRIEGVIPLNHNVSQQMHMILANVGIPMIFWQLPSATFALVPVALLETCVASRLLKHRFVDTVRPVFIANLFSTFIGIPIAWIAMLALNIITTGGSAHGFDTPFDAFRSVVLQASWLVPYEDDLVWLVPSATIVLLVPYFLASVKAEHWFLKPRIASTAPSVLARAVWISNAVSYGCLLAYSIYWLTSSIGTPTPAG